MKILIAEDDPVSSQILELTLQTLGHEVICCSNGLQAWEAFQEADYNIVVSDWDMPEMDGVEFCRKVRAHKKNTYTYFILLTGKSAHDNMTFAMDNGVDDFVPKPLDESELSTRLRVAQRIIGFNQEIRALKTILPICSYCSKIRRKNDSWQRLEIYLEQNLQKDLSHSICPDCYQKHVEPQFQ